MDKVPAVNNSLSRDVKGVIARINLSAIINNAGMIRARDLRAIQMRQEVNKNHVSHGTQMLHQGNHDHHEIQMHQGTNKGKYHHVIQMHQGVSINLANHVTQMRLQENRVRHVIRMHPQESQGHHVIQTHQEVINGLVINGHHVILMHHRESNNLLVSRANLAILMLLVMKKDVISKAADRDATRTETVIVTEDLVRKEESVLLKIILQNDI